MILKTFNNINERMKKILTLFVALMFVIVAYAQANLLTTQLVVDLKEAGTLYNMLSDDQRPLITNLKIKGPINGTDVKCLREMMGKEDNLGSQGYCGGCRW